MFFLYYSIYHKFGFVNTQKRKKITQKRNYINFTLQICHIHASCGTRLAAFRIHG